MTSIRTAVLLAALLLAPGARALEEQPGTPPDENALSIPIKLNGYFWVDTGYLQRSNALKSSNPDQNTNYMQGRFVLAATYARAFGDFSAAAHVELLGLVNEFAQSQYEPHTLDGYVRLGQPTWDLQLGRFLATEVYYRGQGIELYTAEEAGALGGPTMYLLDLTRGERRDLSEVGQAAVHLRPAPFVTFEVSSIYGQANSQNDLGVRPVVDLRLGGLQLVAGAEYLKQGRQTDADKPETTSKGVAARLQYTFPVVTLGADIGRVLVDSIDTQGLPDSEKSLDKTSVGAFADIAFWRGSIGLGYHFTNQHNRRGENDQQAQAFVSYLYRLPIDGLSVKAVYGFARAHVEDISANEGHDNDLNSFRVRLAYEFR